MSINTCTTQKNKKINPSLATNVIIARFSENFDKILDKMGVNFKPCKVYKKNDFVSLIFYYRKSFDSDFVRFRKTFELNRINPIALRMKAANLMAATVNDALAAGWSPYDDNIPEDFEDKNTVKIPTLRRCIFIAHDSVLLNAKARTVSSYNSHLKHLLAYLESIGIIDKPVIAFGKLEAKMYQDFLIKSNLSNKTINTKTDYFSGLMSWLCRSDLIDSNPFSSLKKLKENESTVHDIFTFEEIKKIKNHLDKNCPELWQFILFVYYCFMRPASIVMIRRKDIDIDLRTLKIYGANHKNNVDTVKELLPVHVEYLKPFLAHIPDDFYLFSNGVNLTPGTIKNYPTRASEKWNVLIKNGLGINKNLYGLKHTGAAHFLELNQGAENLKWLQHQLSHADLQTTSIYTNKLKNVRLNSDAVVPII